MSSSWSVRVGLGGLGKGSFETPRGGLQLWC